MSTKITVSTLINSPKEKVWEYYTDPKHITKWNFAHPSWCCPRAENDLKIGGKYCARMEAVDGSFGFDFEAIYTQLNLENNFEYEAGGRSVSVSLERKENQTFVEVIFDAEQESPIEMQQNGWQAILDNFKRYTEAN